MTVGELKKHLENIPNNVKVEIVSFFIKSEPKEIEYRRYTNKENKTYETLYIADFLDDVDDKNIDKYEIISRKANL